MPKTSLFIKDHASQCRNVVRRGDLNSFLKALWDNTALTQKTRIFLSCLLFVSVPHNSFFFFLLLYLLTTNKNLLRYQKQQLFVLCRVTLSIKIKAKTVISFFFSFLIFFTKAQRNYVSFPSYSGRVFQFLYNQLNSSAIKNCFFFYHRD